MFGSFEKPYRRSDEQLIRGWSRLCAELDNRSRQQIWRDIRAGRFPAPIELGPNSVAWFRAEIEEWKRARPRRTYRSAGER